MAKPAPTQISVLTLKGPLLRGDRRPRVALVGRPLTGKGTLFAAASSPSVRPGRLVGGGAYEECIVDVGLDQISLVSLPALTSLHRLNDEDRVTLKHLLWGDQWPAIARHEPAQPQAFAAPDVLIQVADATSLAADLVLTLELALLGRPMVLAVNRMDEARDKGLYVNTRALSEKLGIPVVATVASMGKGLSELFTAAVEAARGRLCPLPPPSSPHIARALTAFDGVVAAPGVAEAFQVPRPLLLAQLAENDDLFSREVEAHFPELAPRVAQARETAQAQLPRPLGEELLADRHHRAAMLFQSASGFGGPRDEAWRRGLDALFLHPRWGLLGSLAVFAVVLYMVFEVSGVLDAMTSARLVDWLQGWKPDTTPGIVGKAVADAMAGLVGIVVPYMLPLVLLLVALEESGIMHRVAFVVDRGFHRIGLHGGVAVPFLIGLGCNVPAISAAATSYSGRDRVVASLLITFVPCSARSAIILALGGKYLGVAGVLGIFAATLFTIALLGKLLARYYSQGGPGLVQEIPPYRLPPARGLLRKTWERTEDIVTIVTPLLVAGSVVLALLTHFHADQVINTLLWPITTGWLGLPQDLGVPILFGVLRKELSLLMVGQALGGADIGDVMSITQIWAFLMFLTFYVPCISTFAVMLKTLGRREALVSVALSVGVALLAAGITRLVAVLV